MAASSRFGGIIHSLRNLGRNGLAVLQNRVELFSVEVEEQKLRLTRILILAGAAVFLSNTAILAISATIVLLAGERAWVPVLIGLSVIYSWAALWAILTLRKEFRSAPPPFEKSMAELKKDAERLGAGD